MTKSIVSMGIGLRFLSNNFAGLPTPAAGMRPPKGACWDWAHVAAESMADWREEVSVTSTEKNLARGLLLLSSLELLEEEEEERSCWIAAAPDSGLRSRMAMWPP